MLVFTSESIGIVPKMIMSDLAAIFFHRHSSQHVKFCFSILHRCNTPLSSTSNYVLRSSFGRKWEHMWISPSFQEILIHNPSSFPSSLSQENHWPLWFQERNLTSTHNVLSFVLHTSVSSYLLDIFTCMSYR